MPGDAAPTAGRVLPRPALLLAGLLGIFLQIQGSFPIPGAGPKGLRLNLADMLLPVTGGAIVYFLAVGRTQLPRWRVPYVYIWLAILTSVLALALLHSHFLYGHVNSWAVTNKFAGWFVLLAYFGLGGWFTVNYGGRAREIFLTAFIGAFIAVLVILLALTFAGIYSMVWGTHPRMIEIEGFMGNRNAYAFLAMAALVFATIPVLGGTASRYYRASASILWFLLPLTIYYNGSRTFLVASALIFLIILLWRGRETARSLLLPLLAGILLCCAVDYIHPRPVAVIGQTEQTLKIAQTLSKDPTALAQAQKLAIPNTSEAVRLRVLSDALVLWRTHPLTGAGLGSFWDFSQKKYAETTKPVEIIDCTSLWLLTETGLAGLAIFSFFFALILFGLLKGIRQGDGEEIAFLQSAVIFLVCFVFMSLFQEILYTRFLWFIMGLALARPAGVTASLP
ncbi:MAG TPA: O-antigen ligase family protein [Patescibacteria group bacterium]|nr:O-antigen ligase family protein [Patescibacteria group bacterium]